MEPNPYTAPIASAEVLRAKTRKPASLRRRFLAGVIDLFIAGAISLFLAAVPWLLSRPIHHETSANRSAIESKTSSGKITTPVVTFLEPHWLLLLPIVSFVPPLLYHSILINRRSATIGKNICHIRVISSSGKKLGFLHPTVRFIASCASLMFFGFGYAMAVVDVERRSFHDRLAGTLVIQQ